MQGSKCHHGVQGGPTHPQGGLLHPDPAPAGEPGALWPPAAAAATHHLPDQVIPHGERLHRQPLRGVPAAPQPQGGQPEKQLAGP